MKGGKWRVKEMDDKTYIGKKTILGIDNRGLIIVSILNKKEVLESGGFEVEEVEESKSIQRAQEIIKEFQNE